MCLALLRIWGTANKESSLDSASAGSHRPKGQKKTLVKNRSKNKRMALCWNQFRRPNGTGFKAQSSGLLNFNPLTF